MSAASLKGLSSQRKTDHLKPFCHTKITKAADQNKDAIKSAHDEVITFEQLNLNGNETGVNIQDVSPSDNPASYVIHLVLSENRVVNTTHASQHLIHDISESSIYTCTSQQRQLLPQGESNSVGEIAPPLQHPYMQAAAAIHQKIAANSSILHLST